MGKGPLELENVSLKEWQGWGENVCWELFRVLLVCGGMKPDLARDDVNSQEQIEKAFFATYNSLSRIWLKRKSKQETLPPNTQTTPHPQPKLFQCQAEQKFEGEYHTEMYKIWRTSAGHFWAINRTYFRFALPLLQSDFRYICFQDSLGPVQIQELPHVPWAGWVGKAQATGSLCHQLLWPPTKTWRSFGRKNVDYLVQGRGGPWALIYKQSRDLDLKGCVPYASLTCLLDVQLNCAFWTGSGWHNTNTNSTQIPTSASSRLGHIIMIFFSFKRCKI